MSIDLSLRRSFFAKYEGRSIEDVVDDVDHPRSSSLQKVNACIWSFSSAEESGERCSNTFQHQLRNILLVYKIYFFFSYLVNYKMEWISWIGRITTFIHSTKIPNYRRSIPHRFNSPRMLSSDFYPFFSYTWWLDSTLRMALGTRQNAKPRRVDLCSTRFNMKREQHERFEEDKRLSKASSINDSNYATKRRSRSPNCHLTFLELVWL